MYDREQFERYRRMTPAERFEMWGELCRFQMGLWEVALDPEEIERRLEAMRRERDLSARNMLEAFRNAK